MRIGILARYCERTNKTGIEQYAHELCQRLLQFPHEFVLFIKDYIEREPYRSHKQVILKRSLPVQLAYELGGRLRAEKCDILFNPGQYAYLGGGGERVVFTVHDVAWRKYPEYFPGTKRIAFESLIRHAVRRADRIIAVSAATRSDLLEYYGCDPGKVVVIPHGFDPAMYNPVSGSNDAKVLQGYGLEPGYVLFLGTLQKRKNVINLIGAFERALLNGKKLVLAGGPGWFYSEILSVIERSEARTRIVVTGFVPEEHKPALYRNAAVFAYPSLYEGFGIPLLEAMACGTQVVCSPVSSMPEVVGSAGFYAEPEDPESIAAQLVQAVRSPKDASVLLARAAEFSWERTADETLRLFEEIL